jgi:hypothetical protein
MQNNSQHYPSQIQKGNIRSKPLWIKNKKTGKSVKTINVDDIFNLDSCAKVAADILRQHSGKPCIAWYGLKKTSHCN